MEIKTNRQFIIGVIESLVNSLYTNMDSYPCECGQPICRECNARKAIKLLQERDKRPKEDKIRILRILEYIGDRGAVEWVVENSINKMKRFNISHGGISGEVIIRAGTIGVYPEILKGEEDDPI